jgi:hypothetical protein
LTFPYRLGEPVARTPGVSQFQIVWDGTRMEVRLVVGRSSPRDVAGVLQANLFAALVAGGAVPPPIDVCVVDALEREPGPAAKLKLIKATAG